MPDRVSVASNRGWLDGGSDSSAVSVRVRPGRGAAARFGTSPCEGVRRSLRKFIHAHDIARGSSELLAIKAADPDLWKRRSMNMRNLAAVAKK
jgi:hypothetical protein